MRIRFNNAMELAGFIQDFEKFAPTLKLWEFGCPGLYGHNFTSLFVIVSK